MRTLAIVVLLAGFFSCTGCLLPATGPWSIRRTQASNAFKAKDWERAESLYSDVLKLNDADLDALEKRGIARFQLRKCLEAEADLSEVLARGLPSGRLHWYRGRARVYQKKFQLALEDVAAGMKVEPHNPLHLYMRSEVKAIQGDMAGALADAEAAEAIEPSFGTVYHSGFLFALVGREAEAVKKVRRAAKETREWVWPGLTLMALGMGDSEVRAAVPAKEWEKRLAKLALGEVSLEVLIAEAALSKQRFEAIDRKLDALLVAGIVAEARAEPRQALRYYGDVLASRTFIPSTYLWAKYRSLLLEARAAGTAPPAEEPVVPGD